MYTYFFVDKTVLAKELNTDVMIHFKKFVALLLGVAFISIVMLYNSFHRQFDVVYNQAVQVRMKYITLQ